MEALGKVVFDSGLSSRLRPRRYYTIPRESLERSLEDVEQLLNFFVIEIQRIVFAENVVATSVVCSQDFPQIETLNVDSKILGLRRCIDLIRLDQNRTSLGPCVDRNLCSLPNPSDLHQQPRRD